MKRLFTPEEDAIISADYADYVDLRAIATKVGRDYGTLRQRILYLGLKRDGGLTKILKWCPEHLKPILKQNGRDAFIEAVNANLEETKQNELSSDAAAKTAMAEQADEIESGSLERREKMLAMRAIGMTLEAIGKRFGITSERVRQLTDPEFMPHFPSHAPRTGSIKNLAKINSRLEAKIKENKLRIKTKALGILTSTWNDADLDVREQFLKAIHESGEGKK